ncbi:IclR family transcriptional regulator [Arthrobacter sp. AK01]|uniref:IclR family transcriptional regulator n=1 Tax=Micrococcaceae TaxID=1268 RepID=UPI001E5DF485|nr:MULTISPECIES: IclR family transcriptional regulator [Micrococcaceae]MCD4852682.1 IclR family transcriptional regulator [Arthrobacter sp. AK01]MCP1411152.1 DNA-binding IclR family transcriptional regulator [Paenarthrobacter sp. A20]
MTESTPGESVISRVVRLMSAFDRALPTMTLSGLARRADLPLTTTHRLVQELARHGLIEKVSGDELRVGMRMWELGARGSKALGLQEVALPYMEDVQATVRQHTTLAVLDRGSVLYVERLSDPESPLDAAHIAQRMPIHAASSGLVLLAFSDKAYQDGILSQPLEAVTPDTITDPTLIRKHLAEIRQRGHVAIPGIGHMDWIGIAVPVFGASGKIAASLNAIVPRDEANVPAIIPSLLTAAHGISRSLGADNRLPGSRRL